MERAQQFQGGDLVRRPFLRHFLLVLLVTAVAKGGAYLPAYSIDDYLLVLRDFPSKSMLRQGRFGQHTLRATARCVGHAFQAFSPCTSRIHLMVCLLSLLYIWNLQYANGT